MKIKKSAFSSPIPRKIFQIQSAATTSCKFGYVGVLGFGGTLEHEAAECDIQRIDLTLERLPSLNSWKSKLEGRV